MNKRGGKRPGAGRPRKQSPLVSRPIRLSETQIAYALAQEGANVSAYIRKLIDREMEANDLS